MKNKTLILPDLHHKVDLADKIINDVKADIVIAMGDIFDDFNDTPEMVRNSAEWLKDFVNKPNHICLIGNHELSYKYPYRTTKCPGYEQWKDFIINDIMSKDDWNKLKWYYILDDKWLLTHAGLHDFHIPEEIRNLNGKPQLDAIAEYLDNAIIQALRDAANNRYGWALNAGRGRGGPGKFGGVVWCDYEREFVPIKGVNQIMGHTPQGMGMARWCLLDKNGKQSSMLRDLYCPTPEQISDDKTSVNINLDVYKNMHYAVWDGTTLTVKGTNDSDGNSYKRKE